MEQFQFRPMWLWSSYGRSSWSGYGRNVVLEVVMEQSRSVEQNAMAAPRWMLAMAEGGGGVIPEARGTGRSAGQ